MKVTLHDSITHRTKTCEPLSAHSTARLWSVVSQLDVFLWIDIDFGGLASAESSPSLLRRQSFGGRDYKTPSPHARVEPVVAAVSQNGSTW